MRIQGEEEGTRAGPEDDGDLRVLSRGTSVLLCWPVSEVWLAPRLCRIVLALESAILALQTLISWMYFTIVATE